MACYLRVYGDELNVKELISTLKIEPSKIWEKGLPRFKSNPEKLNKNSGFNIVVSDAEWNEFEKQKAMAIDYLEDHKTILASVISYLGVEGGYLDFGIEWRDEAVQSDSFPPSLIKLAGKIGLGIELSQYPPDDEE
jgi:hypothetical protein